MEKLSNSEIIEMVKDITIASVERNQSSVNAIRAKEMADFMQIIYEKLVALNTHETNQ